LSAKITVQRSSNVFKAVPGVWHTISSKTIDQNRETVTTKVISSNSSKDWTTIEEPQSHHWLQIRDPGGFRTWVQKKYQELFDRNVQEDNFLIADLLEAKIAIEPKTFRCPNSNCNRLLALENDEQLIARINISEETNAPKKLGFKCPKCHHRPMTQQPHLIIDYERGIMRNLPTSCPICQSPLKLDYTGSVVSIMGWRISCTNSQCSLFNNPEDPFAKDPHGIPIFSDFYDEGRKLSITPTTRGPTRSLVETKIDTAPFKFKPDECTLASLYKIHEAPSMRELKRCGKKLIYKIANLISLYLEKAIEECFKDAEKLTKGNPIFDQSHKELIEQDQEYKKISEKTDESGVEFKRILIEEFDIPNQELYDRLCKLRKINDEVINLLFAEGHTYEGFINKLRSGDPRKTELNKIKDYKSQLFFEEIRYLYPSEVITSTKGIGGFQIVKASFGVDVGLSSKPKKFPFHRHIGINQTYYDKNKQQYREPNDNFPIIFATNHPIEGLFIRLSPTRLIEQEFLDSKYNIQPRIGLSLTSKDKIDKIEIMLHTLSHLIIRRLSAISGLSEGSLSHKIYPCDASILIYTTVHPTLGQLQEVFETKMSELLDPNELKRKAMTCPRDPLCLQSDTDPGSCFACLHIPEYSCDHYWNKSLNRCTLWQSGVGKKGLWK